MSEKKELEILRDLRNEMANRFNKDDLELLANDLGVRWEEISDRPIHNMIQDLIMRLGRNGKISDLVALLYEERSKIDWDSYASKLISAVPEAFTDIYEKDYEKVELIIPDVDPQSNSEATNFIVNLLQELVGAPNNDIKLAEIRHSYRKLTIILQTTADTVDKLSNLPKSNLDELGIVRIVVITAASVTVLSELIRSLRLFFAQKSVAIPSIIIAVAGMSAVIYVNFNEQTSQFLTNQIAYKSGDDYLYLYDVESMEQQLLTDAVKLGSWLSWSPDGRQIGFSNDNMLYTFDITGNTLEPIKLPDDIPTDSFVWAPIWSPDGKQLLFGVKNEGVWKYYLMNILTNEVVEVMGSEHYEQYEEFGHFDWSPDGSKFAFYSCIEDAGCNIQVMNIDGSEMVMLSHNERGRDVTPAWSPDGSKIAFASSQDGGMGTIRIAVIDLISSDINYLYDFTEFVQDSSPSWSPNGEQIIFTRCDFRSNPVRCDVMIIDSDGSDQALLIPNAHGAIWQPQVED